MAESVAPTPYPSAWEADVVLRDGHTVHVRPILAGDAARLARFHERQSPESIYYRFLSPRPKLSAKELAYFTQVDHLDRVAFVATLEDELIAVARYERYSGTDTAEVAFFVDDQHHGRGLATVMLEYLAAAARHRGLRRFTASTLPANRKMLTVFASAGYDVSSHIEDGVVAISFDIAPTDESTAAVDRRERLAEAATVQRLLRPGSVAVIGTPTPHGLGAEVLRSMVAQGYRGKLYAVVGGGGLEVPPGVEVVDDVPGSTDLAVIALPAAQVPEVVERCGRAEVGAIAILSAGFAEAGSEGRELQRRVVDGARRHGVRVLGPNCLGLVNTDPEIRLHATVVPSGPPAGSVAMFTESGGLAAAILEHAELVELGLSTFVAAGNHADVGSSDMLSFWADDPCSAAVLLYLRSSGLPSRLVRAALGASMEKPVAVLGQVFLTSEADVDGDGAQAQAGRRVDAFTRQTGVISVGTLQQLFDIGRLLSDQPVPAGPGVAVVGNSDGAIAVAADACRGSGLRLVDLTRSVDGWDPGRSEGLSNPVDLTYRATAADYSRTLATVAAHPGVHSVLVVDTPARLRPSQDVVDAVVAASAAASEVTFVATMLGAAEMPRIGSDEHRVPVYSFPEHAAGALGRLASYRAWRNTARARGVDPPLGCDLDTAHEVVAGALARCDGSRSALLDLAEQEHLLGAFAVQVAERRVVADPDEAMAAVAEIGWPVALKATRRDRRSRSAASGVAIDLADEADVRSTWQRMEAALGDDMLPVAVQRFVERGVDASVVLRRSEGGTTTVEVGLGGPVSAFDEPQLGILPLTLPDAQALVAGSALGRALPDPLDRVALVGVVHRLAELVEQVEEIAVLEADPVVASVDGAWVADVRIEVRPADDALDVRRLA